MCLWKADRAQALGIDVGAASGTCRKHNLI